MREASVRRPELATFTSAAALEDLLRKLDLTPAETERHRPPPLRSAPFPREEVPAQMWLAPVARARSQAHGD
jgi:hypothetical protein